MKSLEFTFGHGIPLEFLRSLRVEALNDIYEYAQLGAHGASLRLPITDGAGREPNIPGNLLHILILLHKLILHPHLDSVDEAIRGMEQDAKGILPSDEAHSIFLLIPVETRRAQQPVVEPVFTLVGVIGPEVFDKLDPKQLITAAGIRKKWAVSP